MLITINNQLGQLKCLVIEIFNDLLISSEDIKNSKEYYQNINNFLKIKNKFLLNSIIELLIHNVFLFEPLEINVHVVHVSLLVPSQLLKIVFVLHKIKMLHYLLKILFHVIPMKICLVKEEILLQFGKTSQQVKMKEMEQYKKVVTPILFPHVLVITIAKNHYYPHVLLKELFQLHHVTFLKNLVAKIKEFIEVKIQLLYNLQIWNKKYTKMVQ